MFQNWHCHLFPLFDASALICTEITQKSVRRIAVVSHGTVLFLVPNLDSHSLWNGLFQSSAYNLFYPLQLSLESLVTVISNNLAIIIYLYYYVISVEVFFVTEYLNRNVLKNFSEFYLFGCNNTNDVSQSYYIILYTGCCENLYKSFLLNLLEKNGSFCIVNL